MIRTTLILSACALTLGGCTKAKKAPPPDSTAADSPLSEAPLGAPMPVAPQEASFAVATLASKAGGLSGTVTFATVPAESAEGSTSVLVTADLKNATPGDHGFHVHEFGDCSAEDYSSAGEHLNPTAAAHAGPTDPVRHFGDLGNIKVDENGNGQLTETLTFAGQPSTALQELLIGKAVLVHESIDDLTTQPSGNSGKPIACGVIEKAETVAH